MRLILSCTTALFALVWLCPLQGGLQAAVTVITNASGSRVEFQLKGSVGQDGTQTLHPAETRPFVCDSAVELRFVSENQPTVLRLEPYSAYVFVWKKGKQELVGIELAGRSVPSAPKSTSKVAPLRVPVKLLVDDSERRTRRSWEPALRRRVDQAAEILKTHTGVQFEIESVDEWEASRTAQDMPSLLADFEKQVKSGPAKLVIGYTSRAIEQQGEETVPFALSRGAFQSHILLRENHPRSEPERVEVLVQELGKYLGAVASPDPASVMRLKLGDGKAISTRFRIGFDALNTLAMNIWVEHLARNPQATPGVRDLSEETRSRLARVYGTLAQTLPDKPLPEELASLLPRAAIPVADGGLLPAQPPRDAMEVGSPRVEGEPRLTPKEEAIRRVVRAVTLRADSNSRKAFDGADARVRGDALMELLVRTAADVATTEERSLRTSAFLLGLGIALDDSMMLRGNPISRSLCMNVESDAERNQRIAVLGMPTMRFRRDLCQHFVVSCALTELAGAKIAEQAGLAKELLDSTRASGFSFVDLAADLAGVEFAKRLRENTLELETVARDFKILTYTPSIENLPDSMPAATFQERYGSISDPRFEKQYEAVRQRVIDLPAYRN